MSLIRGNKDKIRKKLIERWINLSLKEYEVPFEGGKNAKAMES
jgi:hypothetical protein